MRRSVVRTAVTVLLVATLALPAAATELLMPPQLRATVNVTGYRYAHHRHYASGKLRLHNTSGHHMTVNCQITVTWKRRNGEREKRHRDLDRMSVGAEQIRKAHWHMMFRDREHLFMDVPAHAVPHCRLR